MAKLNYVTLAPIKPFNAHYNLLIGERSNGKTSCVLEEIVSKYEAEKTQSAYLRRWQKDFSIKNCNQLFDSLVSRGVISKITHGKYDNVTYFRRGWYLSKTLDNGEIEKDPKPFMFGFALTDMEHDKSVSYPNIRTIFFDEFLSREGYCPDEFMLLMNTISTIVRNRNDIKIYMCGNTINKYAPYFKEFGLTGITEMKKGETRLYQYGNSELRVVVYFTDSISKKGKPSDVYFAFDNPRLNMITGKGHVWEMDIYPHLPIKYMPVDIKYIFFILFEGNILQCEIIHKQSTFIYIHQKTTPLKDDGQNDLVYCLTPSHFKKWRIQINRPTNKLERKIGELFAQHKVFYQNNEIGEVVRNYLKCCDNIKI